MGAYSATFTLKNGLAWFGGGSGPVTVKWEIVPKDLEESDLFFDNLTQEYSGEPLQAMVKLDGEKYPNDALNLTVIYATSSDPKSASEPINAGTYTIFVSTDGNKNFNSCENLIMKNHKFTITPKDPDEGDIKVTYPYEVEFDEDGNPNVAYDGTSKAPEVSWAGTGDKVTLEVSYYDKDGNLLEGDPVEMGEYEVYVKVKSDDPNYKSTPDDSKGIHATTLIIGKANVSVVSFSSDPVMEGSPMTMKVTFKTAGDITEDPVIRYGDSVLPLTGGGITDLGDGLYEATVVYDTSEGIIPSGIYRTVSVQYPGDDGHHPSDAVDCEVCVRTEGKIVIPDEGGKFPADPGKKNEVVTPTGQMEVVVDDDRTGGTPIIWIRSWDAEDHEKVPEADKTVVIESDGYVIGKDGERIPIGYEIIHTIDVDVPNGKRPIVKLYDEEGNLVETPKIMSYTSGSVTFRTEAEGFQHIRVAVTFETAIIPIDTDTEGPGKDNDAAGVLIDENSEILLKDKGPYILLIAVVAAIIAELAAIAISRKR